MKLSHLCLWCLHLITAVTPISTLHFQDKDQDEDLVQSPRRNYAWCYFMLCVPCRSNLPLSQPWQAFSVSFLNKDVPVTLNIFKHLWCTPKFLWPHESNAMFPTGAFSSYLCVLEWYHGVTRASMRNLADNVGILLVNFFPLLGCRSGSKRVEAGECEVLGGNLPGKQGSLRAWRLGTMAVRGSDNWKCF